MEMMHDNCGQQIAKLSQDVRTLLLTLNDVIVNKLKPTETKVANLETEVEQLKDEMKKLKEEFKPENTHGIEDIAKKVEKFESLTKVEGKIDLLEDKVKNLEVKTFEQSQMEKNLSLHEQRNEPIEKNFHCTYCTRKLNSELGLWRHMKTFHPQMEQKLFKCKHCANIFHSRESLWIHTINVHIDIIAPYNVPDKIKSKSHSGSSAFNL